jgi:hypothetical protein
MALVDTTTLIAVVIVVVVSSIAIIYAMRKREKKPETTQKTKAKPDLSGLPFRITKSVQTSDASQAKDELRILDVEREILSDAIRRLYEAHGEGKISETERDRLAGTYKSRMMNIRESISKDEKIVALHELESMQEDLMKLFSERFGDLSTKVEDLRSKISVEPIKEVKIRVPKSLESLEEQTEELTTDKKRKRRKTPSEKLTAKSEAEKRIEAITNEVEKVLDKLGQIEIDA